MMIRTVFAVMCSAMVFQPAGSHAVLRAALVDDPDQDVAQDLLAALDRTVVQAGYEVARLSFADLCHADRVDAEACDLLILPDASRLPAAAVDPILSFLRAGGDLIALRTPAWQQPLIRGPQGWVERDAYLRDSAADAPPHAVVDFAPGSVDAWTRSSRRAEPQTLHGIVPDGPVPGMPALHVTIPAMYGWDTFGSDKLDSPFPEGHTLTVFAARGGPDTRSLSFEWTEEDGSRWIAVVPLETGWRRYVLDPTDFKFWDSVEARRRTRFQPGMAAYLRFGLAASHTGHDSGRHEYWIAGIGTAPPTPDMLALRENHAAPVIDTISPAYKFHAIADPAGLHLAAIRDGDALKLPVPNALLAHHPRPGAGGFDKGRAWRWMPLLQAVGPDGSYRGCPASLMIHADGEFAGSLLVSCAVADAGWYVRPEILSHLAALASWMRNGVFLIDGGANFYTYFEDQPLRLGATVVNTSRVFRGGLRASVEVRAAGAEDGQAPLHAARWDLDLGPREIRRVETDWMPPHWPEEGLRVDVVLESPAAPQGRTALDRAGHEAHVWRPRAEKRFVTIGDGRFFLDGTPWRAHGVNYMPSSGIASEDWEYFERWLGARSYDPEIVQRDLDRCRDLGFNAVSIFLYHESMESQNLLDILRRIDALGMKANLSLRPGTPMDFLWDQMREMIEYYRLAENDTVFAYDLAWEPSFGSHDERRRWDADWADWIVERYGSVGEAEKDWAYPVPRDADGRITNPRPREVDTDGDWRRMTAAYRRFLDFLLHKKYAEARRLVRTIDPNHPVSFRMSECGNPTYRWGGRITYDFAGLASAVDVFEPEAYGRIGDWEQVKPGWFTFEYARWANPGLPTLWAEIGVSVRDPGGWDPSDERLEFQARYFRDFYRMMMGSGADGVFFWWYPGGYRVGENSDYGIVHPDGTDRPASRLIRDHARPFLDAPPARPPDRWIEFDRDRHPDGLAGIYDAAQEAFWAAIEAGATPGLRTAGTGTTSADCPPVAVGNTPCTGRNPPKYLDAAFDLVEMATPAGWTRIEKGAPVRFDREGPLRLRVALSNIAEAAWLAPRDRPAQGDVCVEAGVETGDGAVSVRRIPIPRDVPARAALEDLAIEFDDLPERTDLEVTLRMVAVDRTPFGERFSFRLEPRDR